MRKSNFLTLIFFLYAFIIFLNLNGVLFLFFNKEAALSPLMLLFTIILFLLNIKFLSQIHISLKYFLIFFLIYFIIGWLSSFFNIDHNFEIEALTKSYTISVIVVLSFYLYFNYSKINDRIIAYITLLLVISTTFIYIAYITGFQEYGQYKAGLDRSAGLFANPNEAGTAANYALVFTLMYFFKSQNIFARISLTILIVFILFCTILTFSKGAILASFIIIIMVLGISLLKHGTGHRTFNILFIGILLSLILTFFFIKNFDEFYSSLSSVQQKRIDDTFLLTKGEFNEETTTERTGLAKISLELIDERPFFGYGLGYFHRLPEIGLGTHNIYLAIWGEAGIFVLIVYCLFILFLWYLAFKLKIFEERVIVFGLLIIITLNGFTNHNLLDDRSTNLMSGFIMALFNKRRLF